MKQGESRGGSCGLPGHVDRVRDHGKEGGTGSFVYIEYDRASKCIHLPPPPRPDSALSTNRAPFCFPEDRQYVMWWERGRRGEVEAEKERPEKGTGNMFRRK